MAIAAPGQARNTAAYFSLNPGYQWYDTSELIIDKDPDTPAAELVPTPGFMPELRLGINLSGYGGAEAFIAGHWWGSGNQSGGGGVAGGLLRLTPLEFFQYLWKPMESRFVDLGFSFGAGYTIVGEDFGYQGWFLQYGVDLSVFILPFLSIGFELPIRQMLYAPLRYTHFSSNRGLCTRGGAAYDRDGREVHRTAVRELNLPDGTNVGALEVDADGKVTGNFILTEVESSEAGDMCKGPGPAAWQYTPMVKITFLVDFGI
ncbi:MAG: hypothetical protein ABIJ09_06980 [Pseudomonadota bacterium]